MCIIFSTCWYTLKAKFDASVFKLWIDNMLSNINNYYLVVYTDEKSVNFIQPYSDKNPRIMVVIKSLEEFYCYKYSEKWIQNHTVNYNINQKVDWKVNMLWSEKINFVCNTIEKGYFKEVDNSTQWYGWCDIGYFRGRPIHDTPVSKLNVWPNPTKINALNPNKIHYACVCNHQDFIHYLIQMINNKNDRGLPIEPIPSYQESIAGGFFMMHKDKAEWWKTTYYTQLQNYFENGYLVKDDQIIVADCVFSNMAHFQLYREDSQFDNWFMFSRLLL